ncbi:hypothetical protein [Streptomyces noursei]|uniref:hypothetical protein n=1 Tax=Streptomyces noursei TaxID=1971 RepID=UPI0005C91B57|nr:hypothetical protein [Streptomyces noursei]
MSQEPAIVIVPMRMDALLANPNLLRGQVFYRAPLAFKDPYSGPEQRPLTTTMVKPETDTGIYLHWHIPEALGRGRVDTNAATDATTTQGGSITFPAAPNRWLIIRYHDTGSKITAAGWLLHSDYTSPHNIRTDPAGGAASPIGDGLWMGRRVELSTTDWKEPSGTHLPRLTVLGPNVAAFAAFQPYCQDVFSFRDPLIEPHSTKAGSLASGTLSYLVAGWHADSTQDITAPKEITDLLRFHDHSAPQKPATAAAIAEALHLSDWHLDDKDPQAKDLADTARTVYHASVLTLPWDNADNAELVNGKRPVHTKQDVRLSVGHDVADALDTLVEQSLTMTKKTFKGTATERAALLRAFHTARLDLADHAAQPADAHLLLDDAHHRDGFRSTPAGHHWKITTTDAGPNPTRDAKLADLNHAQQTLDDALYQTAVLRRRLWDVWWLNERWKTTHNNTPRQGFAEELAPTGNGLAHSLAATLAEVTAAVSARDKARKALAKELAPNDPLEQAPLVAVPLAPYLAATDPAAVLCGSGYPIDRPLRRDEPLPTRTPGKVLTGIDIHDKAGGKITFTAPTGNALPQPPGLAKVTSGQKALDDAVRRLLGELFVLHHTAQHAKPAPGTPWKDLHVSGEETLLLTPVPNDGAIPEFTTTWEQPWHPLFLEWKLSYYPLPYDRQGQGAYWDFDGSRRTVAADKAATDAVQEAGKTPRPYALLGRSLVAPVPRFSLQGRVDAYLDTYSGGELLTMLQRFRSAVPEWDLNSLTLDGLRAALTHRTNAGLRTTPPATPPGGYIDPPVDWADPSRKVNQFVEAVQFSFAQAVLVDTFGRSTSLFDPTKEADTYRVYRARSVLPTTTVDKANPDRFMQLPPRLARPARLRITARPAPAQMDGTGDREYDDERTPEPLPVVAWVVVRGTGDASRLTLDIYDHQGRGVGTVRRIGPDATPGRHAGGWRPLPGSPHLTPALVHSTGFEANGPLLAAFVRSLVDVHPDETTADTTLTSGAGTQCAQRLADLADILDLSLAATHPAPPRTLGTALAAGRLLALVHLRAHIELDGPPGADPTSWDSILKEAHDPHADRRWPVRLGTPGDLRCGLVGYYADAACTTFHTDHRLPGTTSHPWPRTDYIKPIGNGATVTTVAHPRPTKRDQAPDGAGHALALIDPFQTVHAHTDILPTTTFGIPRAQVDAVIDQLPLAVPFGPALAHTTTPTEGSARLTLPAPSPAGTWDLATFDGQHWQHTAFTPGGIPPTLQNTAPDARTGHLTYTPQDPNAS